MIMNGIFLCVAQCISKERVARPRDRARLSRELDAITKLPKSRFVMRCHAAFESSASLFFVTDYLAGGDLFFHLSNVAKMRARQRVTGTGGGVGGEDQSLKGFSEDEARVLLAEITLGLEFMHAHDFIHRDIKVSCRVL